MRLVLLAAALSRGLSLHAGEAKSATPTPDAERLQWWHDARFGLFIHWGRVSLKGAEIGWSRASERPGYRRRGTEVPVEV
jgi:alpha-L-fucosidase